jgi:gamma-glutamyl phosphate reductase
MSAMIQKEYRVDKTRIGFIRFIFEAYEGVAVVTTLDVKTGHIVLRIAPDRVDTADRIVADLKKDFMFNEW